MTHTARSLDPRVRLAGWLAFAAAALTVGLIAYGAWVRASGSGLGCPDWPLCEGQVVPELQGAAAIEYGHRVYAGITMLVTAAAAFTAYRAREIDRQLAWILGGALVVILFQAVLGGATVLTELHGLVRLAHLTAAMVTLALLTAGAVRGFDVRPAGALRLADAWVLLALGAFVVLIGGSIVGTGLSAGCLGFPVCDASSTMSAWLHGLHRVGGALLFLAFVWAGVRLTRSGGPPFVKALTHGGATLMVVQGLAGILTVELALEQWTRVLHLGLAGLVWWVIVALWVLAQQTRSR